MTPYSYNLYVTCYPNKLYPVSSLLHAFPYSFNITYNPNPIFNMKHVRLSPTVDVT